MQEAVYAGYEPWRIEAIDVVYEGIISNAVKNAEYENCNLMSETKNNAIKYKVGKTYLVAVKKLVTPNKGTGLWTLYVINKKSEYVCFESIHKRT